MEYPPFCSMIFPLKPPLIEDFPLLRLITRGYLKVLSDRLTTWLFMLAHSGPLSPGLWISCGSKWIRLVSCDIQLDIQLDIFSTGCWEATASSGYLWVVAIWRLGVPRCPTWLGKSRWFWIVRTIPGSPTGLRRMCHWWPGWPKMEHSVSVGTNCLWNPGSKKT